MSQTYTDPQARERMAARLCPECGELPSWHSGWGGPNGCTLTDNGAAQRIAQFLRDTQGVIGGEA